MDGIIGHTGFVGGHLAAQHQFDVEFNSSNIGQIVGAEFETLVCAAAPGSMLVANKRPESDWEQIRALMEKLGSVRTRRFVLISSIAVLADFGGKDDETSTAFQEILAYGRHRRALERFCQEQFSGCLIVRLPALFGHGLRKNFIFDLLNPAPSLLAEEKLHTLRAGLPLALSEVLDRIYTFDQVTAMFRLDRAALAAHPLRPAFEDALFVAGCSAIQFHNPATTFQYYNMDRLWSDIERARAVDLPLIHLATEPLAAARIHERLLGQPMPETASRLHTEDMHTCYAALWGRSGFYLDDADHVLESLADFFERERIQ